MKQNKKKNRLKLVCLLLVWNISVQADILTDGTVGDIYYLFGDNMIIPESYGTRVGDNLFHSFAMFNIYSGEAVTFTGSNTLQNVIARVTGGDASMINGILSSNIGKANFYFINPAGVTFGKNAVVDVPAAFHVSTANQINFADGSVYSATNPAASTLTIAKPESFGFLGQTGDIVLDGAQIVAKPNQTIDLVANNITLKNNADLYAPAGEVRLVAAKGSQNISLVRDENGFLPLPTQTPNAENSGNISIDNSVIDTTGNGGGRATLWGYNIIGSNNSGVFADNDGSLDAIEGKGINIHAYSLSLDGESIITSDAYAKGNIFASGDAGSVIVKTNKLNLINGGLISSSAFTQGNAGNVRISASQINIDKGSSDYVTGIVSVVAPSGSGNAGDIIVNAGNLDISNGGEIASDTYGAGNTGSIEVNANRIKIDGKNSTYLTGIGVQAVPGSRGTIAGTVTVNAADLTILNAGEIFSNTWTQSNASSVIVNANRLSINGQGSHYVTGIASAAAPDSSGNAGHIIINAENLELINSGDISSSTYGKGNAGSINITASNLTINGQENTGLTGIVSQAEPQSSGHAGSIMINAGNLNILNGGVISSSTGSIGNAGTVIVNAKNLTVLNGADILSNTISSGNAGDVMVSATNIVLDNAMISAAASEKASGKTGNVSINADNLNLFNASQISVANYGSNDTGSILINTNSLNAENGSFISTFANSGNGGNITINANSLLYLQDSGITTTTKGINSNGGDIRINSPVLVMNTGLIQANAEGGQGGDINLNIQALIPSYNSLIIGGEQVPWQPYIPGFNVIQAASATGVNGAVNISSPQFDISGSISGLKTKPLITPDVNRDPCENVTASSLKHGGKGGLPANEMKRGFIPSVTQLPNASDTPFSKPENTSLPQTHQPCKAATI